MAIFRINPILDDSRYTNFTRLHITTKCEATQEQVDALGIPKYVGKLEPNYGFTIDLTASKTTGEINERGIKRITAFLKKAADQCEMTPWPSSCTVSLDEFCKHHGITY